MLYWIILLCIPFTFATHRDELVRGYVAPSMRVDCHPEPSATQDECVNRRSCLWDYPSTDSTPPNAPACYYSTTHPHYAVSGDIGDSPLRLRPTGSISPYGVDEQELTVFGGYVNEHTVGVQIDSPSVTEKSENGRTLNKMFEIPTISEAVQSGDQEAIKLKNDLRYQPVVSGNNEYSFKIVRKSTGRVIWDTSLAGSLQYTPQYVQIGAKVATDSIFGFGEHNHPTFKRDLTRYSNLPMWTRDQAPDVEKQMQNLYGVHNFYMSTEGDGHAHGVFFASTFAQEVNLGPAPHLVYRAIGGNIQLYFFDGPSPSDVIAQYHSLINSPPTMPPYWALGFQLSRWGYENVEEVAAVVQKMRDAGIPHDTQYIDIDYMDRRRDFTYDHEKFHGLPKFVDYLHEQSMRFIAIVDPAISVDYAPFCNADPEAFIQWAPNKVVPPVNNLNNCSKNTSVMLGHVWPDHPAAFPDFDTPKGMQYWHTELSKFKKLIDYDGIWIDMNEPSNFNTNQQDSAGQRIPNLICNNQSTFENPPYKTWGIYQYEQEGQSLQLSDKILCMSALQSPGTHYEWHNTYGLMESIATRYAVDEIIGKRAPVISRSTYATSGKYVGHWLGDNHADWASMRSSIVGVFDMNMFGIPFVGADICGFNGDTTEELCLRWQQLGAFYTFSRNHNAINQKPQDPAEWPTVASATRQSNLFRYWHLPYIYQLMAEASMNGGMVTKPMFFVFTDDDNTYDLDEQFMLGDALVIIPALYKGVQRVRGYVPAGSWYDITGIDGGLEGTGKELKYAGWKTFEAPWTSTATVLMRGGQVILRQKPELTTAAARNNPLELAISAEWKRPTPTKTLDLAAHHIDFLQSSSSASPQHITAWASGRGLWDDGETLISSWLSHDYYAFTTDYGQTNEGNAYIFTNVTHSAQNVTVPPLEMITIYGSFMKPDWSSFKLHAMAGDVTPDLFKSSYSAENGQLKIVFIEPLQFDMTASAWYITWQRAQE